MSTDSEEVEAWEQERRVALDAFCEALAGGPVDLDHDPLAFLPIVDQFVAGQDYESFDEDDWLYLHTLLAAYIAQVLISLHGARWKQMTDERGATFMLVMTGRDGRQHAVSPLDVVYDDFTKRPPVVKRMLATAVVPSPE